MLLSRDKNLNASAQSAEAVEYTDCISGSLGNAEYSFIDIATRSTLARSGSTWYGPII